MEIITNNWSTKKYAVGFALSGGFIKGFAHLGVMQALLEHDIILTLYQEPVPEH